ncbi:MAG: RNA polymerase sigma factor [Gammaproteobacteria bacterium]|nr:RNA polymerase sigma factor [Gammaproteobacteria bacterium]MCF6258835.1 RNA polymerase sigma factor [Gammaproteobacteria bacterium]
MNENVTSKMQCLEAEVTLAKAGNRKSLEAVVRAIQKDVYGIALRFLWHPQDAEDATQEILIKVITNLGGFRGESGFKTWVYRIASNTLLTLKKKRMEKQAMTFDEFAEDLFQGVSSTAIRIECDLDEKLLLEEVKVGCTLAMLMCLDRKHRLAYILGEIVELDHCEAAIVLEITQGTFRKQLSRARQRILSVMTSKCGLVNPKNICRCRKRVDTAVNLDRINPDNLLFAHSLSKAKHFPVILDKIRQFEDTRRVAALYRSHSMPALSQEFVSWLRKVIMETKTPDSEFIT